MAASELCTFSAHVSLFPHDHHVIQRNKRLWSALHSLVQRDEILRKLMSSWKESLLEEDDDGKNRGRGGPCQGWWRILYQKT